VATERAPPAAVVKGRLPTFASSLEVSAPVAELFGFAERFGFEGDHDFESFSLDGAG